jgi:hypothetical protein
MMHSAGRASGAFLKKTYCQYPTSREYVATHPIPRIPLWRTRTAESGRRQESNRKSTGPANRECATKVMTFRRCPRAPPPRARATRPPRESLRRDACRAHPRAGPAPVYRRGPRASQVRLPLMPRRTSDASQRSRATPLIPPAPHDRCAQSQSGGPAGPRTRDPWGRLPHAHVTPEITSGKGRAAAASALASARTASDRAVRAHRRGRKIHATAQARAAAARL